MTFAGGHHGPGRDRELQRTVAQPRAALHLDRDPALVVKAVHKRIHTAIQEWQEHMQPAPRPHPELDPHLPLDQLTDNRRLGTMPGTYVSPSPRSDGSRRLGREIDRHPRLAVHLQAEYVRPAVVPRDVEGPFRGFGSGG